MRINIAEYSMRYSENTLITHTITIHRTCYIYSTGLQYMYIYYPEITSSPFYACLSLSSGIKKTHYYLIVHTNNNYSNLVSCRGLAWNTCTSHLTDVRQFYRKCTQSYTITIICMQAVTCIPVQCACIHNKRHSF